MCIREFRELARNRRRHVYLRYCYCGANPKPNHLNSVGTISRGILKVEADADAVSLLSQVPSRRFEVLVNLDILLMLRMCVPVLHVARIGIWELPNLRETPEN